MRKAKLSPQRSRYRWVGTFGKDINNEREVLSSVNVRRKSEDASGLDPFLCNKYPRCALRHRSRSCMFLGLVIAISFSWVVALAPAPSPGYPSCNVCGQPGYTVTNKNATISFPGYPPFTCDVIQRGALAGFVNPMYCPVFPLFNIPKICGCTLTPTAPPTLYPTPPPTLAPSIHVLVTFAPTHSPSTEPTFTPPRPSIAPLTFTLVPVETDLTTKSPTPLPTSHVFGSLPSRAPVAEITTPVVPPSTQVIVTSAPVPAILGPEPTSDGQPSPAPAAPSVLVVAPFVVPTSQDVPVVPVLSPPYPQPTTASITSVNNPTRSPVVLSTHPYRIVRKRRPTKPFHIGGTPVAVPSRKPTISTPHRRRNRPIPLPSASSPRQPPSQDRTYSPRRRRPNNPRNNPPTTATPTPSRSRAPRHRRKPSAQTSTARDSSVTPAPSIRPKGASRGKHRGKGNIFDRGNSPTKLRSKLFKNPHGKKARG